MTLALALVIVSIPVMLLAYPDAEITSTESGYPPLDFGVTAELSGFHMISDRRLALSYSESVKIFDMGHYAAESSQPPALTSDHDTDGVIGGIVYESTENNIYASQDDGDLLVFSLADITATPVSITLLADKVMGPVAADTNGKYVYVANNTDHSIHVVDLITQEVESTISVTLAGVTSFTFTDAIFVDATDEAYFTTSGGYVVYLSSGASTASQITIAMNDNLTCLASYPNGDYIYIVDATVPEVARISTSSHTVVATDIDISRNSEPTDIAITEITNPTGTYAYVAGAYGVSIIDAGSDEVLDMGTDPDYTKEPLPTSAVPQWLAASSSTDGYVYMGFATQNVGVISADPWVAITGITYSSGGSTLGQGENFAVTFRTDSDGTYEIRSGGSVDADGTLLTDSSGATGGTVTANTDTAITFNYDDNSSAFSEGANDLWVFVTSDSIRGRRAATLTIDTPPGIVNIVSTSFGNERIYVTFDRITAADMSKYRLYVDTDEATALAMADPTVEVAQASSGTTQTAEITGLVNDTLYYVAVDAVDANGNVSASRSVASESPAATMGPAELLGESGCALVVTPDDGRSRAGGNPVDFSGCPITASGMTMMLLGSLLTLSVIVIMRMKRRGTFFFAFIAFMSFACVSFAQQETAITESEITPNIELGKESPQLWELEVKTGFWMPMNSTLKQSFGYCCNLITRIEGGLLLKKRYGIGVGAGFLYKKANAQGTGSHAGETSSDRFTFLLFPFETNFTWRMQYASLPYVVPYTRVGVDYVVFRESLTGRTTSGVKYGAHGGLGLQIDIGTIGDVSRDLDDEFGINEFFFTLETMYQWIDNFGGKGLDLSGPVFSAGLLFEF